MQVASLTELIMTSQNLMRDYAFRQFSSSGLGENMAKLSSRSCVSQRDIQRVFTLYQWVKESYARYKPYGKRQDYNRRAVLVALGIVYYMRLNNQYRKDYKEYLDKQVRVGNEVSFSEVGIKQLVLLCNVFTINEVQNAIHPFWRNWCLIWFGCFVLTLKNFGMEQCV